jgi:YD repeat-containing protein
LGYDEARQLSLSDPTGVTTYTYDGLDQPQTTTHSVDGTVTTSFDALGRRTALSTSTGAPALTYQYDAAGRLTDVLRAGSLHTHAAYDAAGRLSSLTRANGAGSTYSYDGANRLTGLQTATAGTAVSSFGYTLNRAGQATLLTETLGGTSRTMTATYDGLRRLVDAGEAPGHHYGYSYDLVGNRLDATVAGVSGGSHSYDAADQVVGWSYDGAGNLLVDDTNLYSYDGANRLTG